MINKIFCTSSLIYKTISNLSLIGKIHCPRMLSSFFNSYSDESFVPSLFLDKENRGIIDQISSFGRTLEQYHPGKTRTLLNKFAKKYEEAKEDLHSLKDIHAKALEAFEKEYNNILLKISLSDKQKNEVAASFGKFSKGFTALINIYDANKLKEAYDLLDAFNETVLQSHQLYIGLSKVVSYIESKYPFSQTFKEQLKSINLLKKQFDPHLEDQSFNQVTKKEAKRARLLDLIADVNTVLKTLVPEIRVKTIGKNDYIKNELLKTILQKSEKVISFMQTHMEKHRKSVFKKIKAHLKDDISSFEDLQNKLKHLPDDKKAQDLLLALKKMRFYLKDNAPCSSCDALKKELGLLLKEQPYLFTKREKKALDSLLENLSVISNGKHFNKEALQKQLNQCREIIKELIPKKTIFSKITASLSKLKISFIKKSITPDEHERLIALLNEFTKDPKISLQEDERKEFSDLKKALLFDPNQPISEEKVSALQTQKCLDLVEEIKKRPPPKEGSKLAIEQELQKLAKHATNLSFMMFIDKIFFNATRDSLFYRNIIQKSEELNSCPKKLFLDELKIQGFAGWKIVSARVCFFIAKHLRIESYFHRAISRTISNYSKMIYQKLDQECTRDKFQTLSQKIVENAKIHFDLLSSAILKAKEAAERYPNPEQITTLIVNQFLKPVDNKELTPQELLKEIMLQDLYIKLIDDLAEKSESPFLKWLVSYLDKPALISSIIEISTDSLLKPAPNGNASALNLLIRDSLRTLYKKLQQLDEEESQKEQVLPSNFLAGEFAENLMRALNEYRDIQQMASFTQIAMASKNFLNELYKHAPNLEGGVLDQQLKNYKQINYNVELLADFKKRQILKEEKDREALFILPVLRDNIMTPLKKIDKFFLPHPISSETTQENTVSVTEVIIDKVSTSIKVKVDQVIKEKITLALTNLLKAPPSEETLYGLIHQGLMLINQSIEHPKENKEKQDAVEKEITELLSDISAFIASTVPADIINSLIGIKRVSSKLAEKNPFDDLPLLISPIIQRRLQNIVNLATEKALYQPELIAQLDKRNILPVNAT